MEVASIIRIVVIVLILVYSCILHEIMHGWSALKMGDDTAKRMGRLTLNPIPHIDPFFTILLPAMLLLFSRGTFCFGGAKPVQINPLNFRSPGKGMMISAAAGPLTNFALAALAAVLLVACARSVPGVIHQEGALTWNGLILGEIFLVNVLLGIFNLIPIPPLDGSRVLRYFLPYELQLKMDRIEQYGLLLVMVFIVISRQFGILSSVLIKALLLIREPMGDEAWEALLRGLFGG